MATDWQCTILYPKLPLIRTCRCNGRFSNLLPEAQLFSLGVLRAIASTGTSKYRKIVVRSFAYSLYET